MSVDAVGLGISLAWSAVLVAAIILQAISAQHPQRMTEDKQIDADTHQRNGEPEVTEAAPFMPIIPSLKSAVDQHPGRAHDKGDANRSGDQPSQYERQNLRTQRIIAGTGIALAAISFLANVAMYYVTNKGADAAKNSAEEARRSVEAQSRPFLIMQNVRFTDKLQGYSFMLAPGQVGPPYEDVQREIAFTIENAGRGTAFQVYVEAFWRRFEDTGVPFVLSPFASGHHDLLETRLDKSMLAVADHAEGSGYMPRRIWDTTVENQGGGFQLLGWIAHCDVLDIARYDPFCFMVYKSLDPCIPGVASCGGLPPDIATQRPWYQLTCR